MRPLHLALLAFSCCARPPSYASDALRPECSSADIDYLVVAERCPSVGATAPDVERRITIELEGPPNVASGGSARVTLIVRNTSNSPLPVLLPPPDRNEFVVPCFHEIGDQLLGRKAPDLSAVDASGRDLCKQPRGLPPSCESVSPYHPFEGDDHDDSGTTGGGVFVVIPAHGRVHQTLTWMAMAWSPNGLRTKQQVVAAHPEVAVNNPSWDGPDCTIMPPADFRTAEPLPPGRYTLTATEYVLFKGRIVHGGFNYVDAQLWRYRRVPQGTTTIEVSP
jgi:hypothetical protein